MLTVRGRQSDSPAQATSGLGCGLAFRPDALMISTGSVAMTAIPRTDAVGPGRADADLVRAAAAGDRRAFEDIYNRYADRLHDFCIGMLRDRDAAADCVQDTFCTAATILGDLREPDKLRPWLYSIARHQAYKILRSRRRERASDELPDAASRDAGPNTLATRLELSSLVSEAAGGLSERDRTVLDLAYRHGLNGPELATALGVSQTNANTMLNRMRDTVERSLGALLVSRRARTDPSRCPSLSAILQDWDGRFTMLMRKRIARHIESCMACEDERRRLVNPAALLAGAPVLIPAPGWLRDRTMAEVRLTSASSATTTQTLPAGDSSPAAPTARMASTAAARTEQMAVPEVDGSGAGGRRVALLVALLIGVPLTALGVVFGLTRQPTTAVTPVDETATSAPVATPRNVAPTAKPSTAKTPDGQGLPTQQQQVAPRPSVASQASSTATATAPAPAPPPTSAVPNQEGGVEASSPVPQPNQTVFTPPPPVSPPPPEPEPNQLPPPPDEPAAEQELPPLITQGPLPDYFEDDPFVPPN